MLADAAAKAAAKAAAAAAAAGDGDGDEAAAAGAGGSSRPVRDLEDLAGAAGGSDQRKASAAGPRTGGRARVVESDEEGGDEAAADAMQVDDVQLEQQRGQVRARDQQQEQQQDQAQPAPDRVKDYRGWVAWQKSRWQVGWGERKRRKTEAARRPAAEQQQLLPVQVRGRGVGPTACRSQAHILHASHACTPQRRSCTLVLAMHRPCVLRVQVAPSRNVGAFFKQQQAAAAASHWQLLQLAPTPTPGVFRLWALADSALYAVPLRVPRRIVVNSDAPPAAAAALAASHPLLAGLTPCKALLPPGDEPRHLYEVNRQAGWHAACSSSRPHAAAGRMQQQQVACSRARLGWSRSCLWGLAALTTADAPAFALPAVLWLPCYACSHRDVPLR